MLYLIGPMGSGKTFAGRQIARHFQAPFFDLDEEIQRQSGKSISQLFEQIGEKEFRELEAGVLRSIDSPGIMATGGGTPCFKDNLSYINKKGISLYLRTDAAVLASRLKAEKDHRPLISKQPDSELLSYLEKMIQDREKYYNQAQIIYHQHQLKQDVAGDLIRYFKPFSALFKPSH